MISCSNILLIAGGGQNVGKTTLVCNLIQEYSKSHEIVAIKMSSHLHTMHEQAKYILNTESAQIIEEDNPDLQKDSGKMLQAGASKVYYIQATKTGLESIIPTILELIGTKLCICESGALRQYITPAIFMYITAQGKQKNAIHSELADIVVHNYEFESLQFNCLNNTWKLV